MITLDRANALLDYVPDTGIFYWKVNRHKSRAGAVAGSTKNNGYIQISIDHQTLYAHRLAWLIAYGRLPNDQLDHLNGIRADNRIANLREATSAQNKHNAKRSRRNKSGFKGVSWTPSGNKWRAEISHEGRKHDLGVFHTPEAAHAAYCEAADRLHGQFAHHG